MFGVDHCVRHVLIVYLTQDRTEFNVCEKPIPINIFSNIIYYKSVLSTAENKHIYEDPREGTWHVILNHCCKIASRTMIFRKLLIQAVSVPLDQY